MFVSSFLAGMLLFSGSVVQAGLLPRQTTKPSKYLFIFGDSYTMTGFNISSTPQPSVSNPLGNGAFPGVRQSGGDMWVDMLMKNNARAGTVVYDLAVGGNPVNAAMVKSSIALPEPVTDYRDQLQQFTSLIGSASSNKIGWNSTNSLFISAFGVNDVALQAYAGRNASVGQQVLQPDVVDYFNIFGQQYSMGVRKFVVILVPPIFRAGVFGYGNSSNAADVKTMTTWFNNQIKSRAATFRSQYPLASLSIADPTPYFNTILDNPTRYGAPNSTCQSYPAGQPCLWHDFIHPGIVLQRTFGQVMSNALRSLGF
ncbi:cellulose-binding gdsl lipase acylhydrolase like protein [Zymoseptoria brevis]|uniref:Cellulose-binding gdsl lipase acylhydrolase like protein n=1 Tax=Zymoseptoria brevis TaxID=1047168 RepID=A0A0F4GKU1_9PEZI|nr:cellulose-binding gdsl lipase acylhydrolase like protein [Zymoseptoria brevis]